MRTWDDDVSVDYAPGSHVLPDRQLWLAHYAAARFGHEWTVDNPSELYGMSLDEIAAATRARRHEGVMSGIECPMVMADGTVVHTTMSGRTTWRIWPDGFTWLIEIGRPAGVALRFRSGEENLHGADVEMEVVPDGGAIHHRHVHAALDVLLAMCVSPHEVLRLLAPIYVAAEPDERMTS